MAETRFDVSLDDLLTIGVLIGGIWILSSAGSEITDAIDSFFGWFGITPSSKIPSGTPPAPPVDTTKVFSPGICPAGYIAPTNADGTTDTNPADCIQVTGAIHP